MITTASKDLLYRKQKLAFYELALASLKDAQV